MGTEVVMPRLGLTMIEGTLVKWLKSVGDEVLKGAPLFIVETDKVTEEVQALANGVLGQILVGEGNSVEVGGVIAYLTAQGETIPAQAEKAALLRPEEAHSPAHATAGPMDDSTQWRPQVPVTESGLTKASPVAKRLAKTLGVDLRNVTGTGPEGRIVEGDVRRSAAGEPVQVGTLSRPTVSETPATRPEHPSSDPASTVLGERVELRGIRKFVADRMVQSFTSAPHFYLTVEANASALTALSKQVSAVSEKEHGLKVTITDWLVRATAIALREHPVVNAVWTPGASLLSSQVNLGVAVATEGGLVVVVIPDADGLSLVGIAARRRELVQKARSGLLTLPDLEGGTFTLSNLGMYGIDQFEAIVNPPQAAILAVGRIKNRVVASEDQAVVRPTAFLTLSSDHRILDGAMAAQFLARVVQLIENPAEMLITEPMD